MLSVFFHKIAAVQKVMQLVFGERAESIGKIILTSFLNFLIKTINNLDA